MDDVNTNKQFRIYDATKKFTRLSVDETIAQGYTKWKDWSCSAGVRSLYIDYDGNIWMCNASSGYQTDNFNYANWVKFSSESKSNFTTDPEWEKAKPMYVKQFRKREDAYNNKMLPNTEETKNSKIGYLGNIAEGFTINTNWVKCPWDKCNCGADVILSKAKTESFRSMLAVTDHGYIGKENTQHNYVESIAESVAVEMNFPIPYQVLWDLGRLCNYDCSYCWPNVHNRHEQHKNYNDLINTCNKVIDDWSHGETIRWNFGGGEPTLHPQFLDMLQYLKSRNQWTMVTSNGTRDHKYWSIAAENLNSVNLSAHFDGLKDEKDEDRFVRNVEVICKHFDEHNDDHWLEVKLMAPPQYIDRALKLRDKIAALGTLDKPGANNRIKGVLSLVPIRSLGDSGALVQYTDEQLELFKNQ
jgi:sulfatase maturation enzyme AslB (radical SAM superfamily)